MADSSPNLSPYYEDDLVRFRAYAESSKSLTHGDKTEDELLQRIWNLAGDVIGLLEQLETAVSALEHIGSPNYSARPTGRDALDMAEAARAALRRIRQEDP